MFPEQNRWSSLKSNSLSIIYLFIHGTLSGPIVFKSSSVFFPPISSLISWINVGWTLVDPRTLADSFTGNLHLLCFLSQVWVPSLPTSQSCLQNSRLRLLSFAVLSPCPTSHLFSDHISLESWLHHYQGYSPKRREHRVPRSTRALGAYWQNFFPWHSRPLLFPCFLHIVCVWRPDGSHPT